MQGFSLHGVQASDPVDSSPPEDVGSAEVSNVGSLVVGSLVVVSVLVTGVVFCGAGVVSVEVLGEGVDEWTSVVVAPGLVGPPVVGALVVPGDVGVEVKGAVELFDVVSVGTAGLLGSVLPHAAKTRLEIRMTGRRV